MFYSSFYVHNYSNETAVLKQQKLLNSIVSSFSVRSVVIIFKHCKSRTSPGPDNIGSCLLC